MKDANNVVNTMYLLMPKTPAINTAYTTYKGVIAFAGIYEAKHVCLLLNKDLFEYSPMGTT